MHYDTVVDLAVDGDTTTEDHPFWSITDQRIERAGELTSARMFLERTAE